jgi:hypothetical protein
LESFCRLATLTLEVQALSVFLQDVSNIGHCSFVVHKVAHNALGSTLVEITLKSCFPLDLIRSRSLR